MGFASVLARFRTAFAALLVVIGAVPALAQEAPEEQIARLNTTLLEAMKNAETLGFEGRYRLMEPALDQTFDFDEMAQAAAGSFWNKFDATERERYVDAFERMSIATFASRFDGYSGEEFEIVGEKPGPRDTKMVETRIVSPGEEPVAITYLFRETDEGWQTVDVYLQSTYSEIAIKRSEYTSLLRQGGLDGLINALDRKIEQMRSDSAA